MEEISLRECIEILIKRKWMIATITVISILLTGIISFFILDPVYETRMVLMASNFSERLRSNEIQGDGIESILRSITQYPTMTLETYRQQIKAPRILRETIEDLGLQEEYDVETLADAIALETIKDTNLITIKMRGKEPEKIASIVNKIGEKFVVFVSDKAKEQATTTSKYLENQMVVEKQKLDEALLELKEFLAQPVGTSELSKELEAKLDLITRYKTSLIEEELKQEVLLKSIEATELELRQTEMKLVTSKSIIEDSLLTDLVRERTDGSTGQIAGITVENEEINPVYILLKEKLAEFHIELAEIRSRITNLQKQIANTQNRIETLQIELADKKHEERLIHQKVEMAQNTYDALTKKYEEVRITESSQIGEASIIVISRAYPTTNPVAPRKSLNVAIAAVLGMMIGVFIAFFAEYWQMSAVEKARE